MQPGSMKAKGGRDASRERREQLSQGKGALPPSDNRSRIGRREAAIVPATTAAMTPSAPTPSAPPANEPAPAAAAHAPMAWGRSRITGTRFSSDESNAVDAEGAGSRVTGDTPTNVSRVTGTQRGADREITGTTYYRARSEGDMKSNGLDRAAEGFTVRPPQRESQLRADASAVRQPSAAGRITGTFARGEGKITGNQEFHYSPRQSAEHGASIKVTGEGRSDGPKMTGGAWDLQSNVTGTEGYIAAERNPSARAGQPQGFAGSKAFKGKGNHAEPTHHVTGMVGWSPKASARVTLSGGGRG